MVVVVVAAARSLNNAGGALPLVSGNQSIALAKYLEVAPDLRADEWPAKRVIEVGAGCGLVGIALGLQGMHACTPCAYRVATVEL